MFNFLKSEKRKRLEKAVEQVDTCVRLIHGQMGLVLDDPAGRARMQTLPAYGYVFGFADAMFLRWKVENGPERLVDVLAVFKALYGMDEGDRVMDVCLAQQTAKAFLSGRLTGGEEVFDWAKSRGDQVPTGLAEYLMTGQMRVV